MKIIVDRGRCRGQRNCISAAPEVFDLDEEFKAVLVDAKGNSDKEILFAAQICPTKAIILEDEETGERIYPKEK